MNKSGTFKVVLNKSLGPLALGMSKTEVEKIIGKASDNYQSTFYYFNNNLQLEFDINGCLAFIQLSNNQHFIASFKDLNLFDLKDIEIDDLFSCYCTVDRNDPEYGYSYNYRSLQLIFWRKSNPENLRIELNELKETDEDYSDQLEFYLEEIQRCQHFDTIAIYVEGYYDN
ncbi:hypothetical protein EZV73_15090 [Acidaminobacter sp. JC074]|uniref:hypothetical protein n=1 Tax=Acidaminobacter sp. JC074 TaxID=2530199 RepID=UPI001F0F527E|nr:hypothetical protein [Acidaminobacter sp. JC074]MCH4888919.1 hypothetical protein [Acidaminobacter sp. JC074]